MPIISTSFLFILLLIIWKLINSTPRHVKTYSAVCLTRFVDEFSLANPVINNLKIVMVVPAQEIDQAALWSIAPNVVSFTQTASHISESSYSSALLLNQGHYARHACCPALFVMVSLMCARV